MKLFHVFTGLLLFAAPALAQSINTRDPLGGDSIFSKVRGLPGRAATSQSRPSLIRTFSTAPQFVGTFQEQDHCVAFIEAQTSAGSGVPATLLTLREGETIDQFRVLEITSDSLVLTDSASQTRVISLGNNLLNQPNDVPTPGPISPPARLRQLAPTTPQAKIRRGTPLGIAPAAR